MRPVERQHPQQLVLLARGVLEFIDEDVLEPRVEAFRERRRARIGVERLARVCGNLGVIAFTLGRENAFQFGHGAQQQAAERFERGRGASRKCADPEDGRLPKSRDLRSDERSQFAHPSVTQARCDPHHRPARRVSC